MSLKDWKNKELNENLSRKWGFKMDLSKLKEGIGAGVADPMGGEVAWEKEPPMSNQELGLGECIEAKIAQGMSGCEAEALCRNEMGVEQEPIAVERDPELPFQEEKLIDEMSAAGAGAVAGHAGQKRRTK